jgi:hypothetical protein
LDHAYRRHALPPHIQFKPNITGFLKHDTYPIKTDKYALTAESTYFYINSVMSIRKEFGKSAIHKLL